jgi:hypothetical protein
MMGVGVIKVEHNFRLEFSSKVTFAPFIPFFNEKEHSNHYFKITFLPLLG